MVWSGCCVVSLTWPLCTTYSQAGGRSDLRQGVSLTRRLTKSGFVVGNAACTPCGPNAKYLLSFENVELQFHVQFQK